MKNIEFQIENNPTKEDDQIVIQGITDYNNSIHHDPVSHHSIYAKNNGDIIGGALVYQHSDAVYIDTFWVKEDYRRKGIATELLKRVEHDAYEKGIVKQIICTISPQARDMYQKLGFQLIATVPEYLRGLDKFYLKKTADKSSVKDVYNKISDWFDGARTKTLEMEQKYLQLIINTIPPSGTILDVGCGSGEPLAKYFIDRGYSLVGLDNSEAMLELCRKRFPKHKWLLMDMRRLQLEESFDCVIAWHSFFHIPKEEQEAVLVDMIAHVADKGLLVFTSGVEHGEVWSNNGGEMLFHASLSSEEYQQILKANNMKVLQHNVSDPDCSGATVWVAQKS